MHDDQTTPLSEVHAAIFIIGVGLTLIERNHIPRPCSLIEIILQVKNTARPGCSTVLCKHKCIAPIKLTLHLLAATTIQGQCLFEETR